MSDKWEWREAFTKVRLTQADVARFRGLTSSQMSQLARKMIVGRGLTATARDNRQWDRALDYIRLRENEVVKETSK